MDELKAVFRRHGWAIARSARCDFLARKAPRAYAVRVKALSRKPERALLEPLLASAILETRAGARDPAIDPLAIVAARHVSPALLRGLEEYVERFAPGSAWGAVGSDGRVVLRGPGLESMDRLPTGPPDHPYRLLPSPGAKQDPFTDLGQWMIKVLLAPEVPDRWLHAPRDPIGKVQDLARSSSVSMASASKLLSALEARGHLDMRNGRLEIVRKRALLESWRSAVASAVDVPCDFMSGVDLASSLRENAGDAEGDDGFARSGRIGRRACLGLFTACEALGLGFVKGAPAHVLVESLDPAFLESLGVYPVQHPSQAEVFLRVPRFPQSVFRGCVVTAEGPTADAVQCFVDVSSHPSRGGEQAEEILRALGVE